jgi:uncharacterized protein YggU (UPF0235/DUF167 family)
LAGERQGALLVRLNATPVEGQANRALLRLLARVLGVPASAVRLVRGAKARDKLIEISGLGRADVLARLSEAEG